MTSYYYYLGVLGLEPLELEDLLSDAAPLGLEAAFLAAAASSLASFMHCLK